MARIYLDNETYAVTGKASVYGGTGTDIVQILPGATAVTVDSNIEKVSLGARLDAYQFKLTGNVVDVTLNGATVATIAAGESPTLVFADGSAKVAITGLGTATLGGAVLTSTATSYTTAQTTTFDTTVKSDPSMSLSNAAPVITVNAGLAINEDAAATAGLVTATDANKDTVTYAFGTAAHGAVVGKADGTYTYTPAANFNGTDTFSVSASDIYTSTPGTVTVTVAAVNDTPTATKADVSVVAGKSVTGTLVGADVDTADATPQLLTYEIATQGTKGTAVITNAATGAYTYTPLNTTVKGEADSFTFTVKDNFTTPATSTPATVSVTVINTDPVATALALTAKTGVTQTVDLTGKATDADGHTLTPHVVVGSVSKGGSAEVINNKIVYTSTVGFVGTETLTYNVTDGFGGTSADQTITFTVSSNTGGTSGPDLLYGSSAAENIDGLAGNDTIVGGGGLDTIAGGDDTDTITFNDAAAQIQGGAGNDTLVVNADAAITAVDLSAIGSTNQVTTGGLNTLNQSARVYGFENLDASKASNPLTVTAAASTTSIITGTGNDTITGGAGVQTIDGGAGNDSITGGAGVDYLIGGDGNDIFVAATVADMTTETISGGSGTDSLNFSAGADVTVLAANLANISSVENINFLNVTNTSTITLADSVYTANGLTSLTVTDAAATSGVLTVNASALTAANSVVVDLSGAATNAAANQITGGAGNDTVKVDASEAGTALGTSNAGSGTDTLTFVGTGTATLAATVTNFEKMTFDTITGATYNITTDNANVASAATFTVDAANLTTSTLTFNGAAETDGKFSITGGSGIDNLTGGSGSDTIYGGAGNDIISGGSGVDSISGDAGNDSITGGAGVDYLSGGDGNDTFAAATVADMTAESILGGLGTDKLQFADAGQAVTAAALANINSIETVEFLATSNTSNITLTDAVYTANGLTSLTVTAAAATSGVTTVNASALTAANSVVVDLSGSATNAAANQITGGSGDDTVKVDAAEAATALGTSNAGAGTDTITFVATGTSTLAATVTNFEKMTFSTITGATYNITTDNANVASATTFTVDASNLTTSTLTFAGTAETDGKFSITGGSGIDNLTGGSGADTIYGGAGNDIIAGGSGADSIYGDAGNDSITGGTQYDYLDGGAGNDIFQDFTASVGGVFDTMIGGAGTDTLKLTAGSVSIAAADLLGISSVDNISFQATTQTSAVTLTNAVYAANGATTLTVSAPLATSGALTVDASALSADNSVVVDLSASAVTNNAANAITGGAGNDIVKIDLNDTANAGWVINGGSGTDTLTAVAGGTMTIDDGVTNFEKMTFATATGATYAVTTDNANVASGATFTVDASTLTTSTLSFTGSAETDGVFSISGGSGADVLTGGSGADTIDGGDGADTLSGGSGADSLLGGAGNDTISGGAGTDTLTGGDGNDSILGGGAGDSLTGGSGADWFQYTAVSDSSGGLATTRDTIADFVTGTDMIDVSTLGIIQFVGNRDGFANSQLSMTPSDGILQTTFDTSSNMFYVDSNDDGSLTAADFAIYMPGVTSMQVADVYKSIATSSFALDATATSYVGTNANDAFTTSALANIGTGAGSCLGGSGTDSIVFTTSGLAVADADLTGHTSIENVVLGGAGSTVLAAGALASGISSVRLGVGATALTTANTLTVDAERLAANTALTVSGAGAAGAGAVTITNLQGDIADANTHTGTMNIALVSNVLDNGVSIITGAGNVSVTGGAADDTVTIDATLLDTANTITVSAATSAALTVTALVGSVVATNLAGALTITTADDAGNAIGITTGSGNVTVTGGAAGDTITVTGLATDGQTFTGSVSKFSITAGAGAQTITTGALADIIAAGEGNDTITGGAGDDSITGGTGADSIVGGATDHIYVSAGDSGLGTITTPSITTNNMDKITVAATTILDLTGAVQTKANYDNFTEVAAGGAITTTLVTNEVGQFVGVWDSATEVFTSSATNAAATASATDEDALLYTYAVADGTNTVATQGVIVLGVGAQTDADIENGIITFASGVGATFTLTTGVDNKIGGPGDDTFVATYDSGIASDTFENGDTLNGNGGIDTVTIDQFIGDVAITAVAFEALWTNVTNMEKVVINQTGAGAQTITTGGAFNTAFNGAVDIKTSTTAGAIDISGANLVKVDATTTGAGAQTILSTGAANVTVNTTSNDGATTITTGAGNDTITLYATSAGGANSITGGAGADTIALYTNFSSVDTINIAAGDSLALAASYDMISNFTIANDILNLPSTTIAGAAPGVDGTNAGTLKSHTILNGLITFDTNDIWDGTAVNINAANVADAIAYCVANITVGTQSVMFQYDASGDGSYGVGDAVFIFQNGATDTLVELVGLDASSHTKLAAASAANTVVIA